MQSKYYSNKQQLCGLTTVWTCWKITIQSILFVAKTKKGRQPLELPSHWWQPPGPSTEIFMIWPENAQSQGLRPALLLPLRMETGLVEGADCIILHPSIFGSFHFLFHFINTPKSVKLSRIQMLGVFQCAPPWRHGKEAMIAMIKSGPPLVTGTDAKGSTRSARMTHLGCRNVFLARCTAKKKKTNLRSQIPWIS